MTTIHLYENFGTGYLTLVDTTTGKGYVGEDHEAGNFDEDAEKIGSGKLAGWSEVDVDPNTIGEYVARYVDGRVDFVGTAGVMSMRYVGRDDLTPVDVEHEPNIFHEAAEVVGGEGALASLLGTTPNGMRLRLHGTLPPTEKERALLEALVAQRKAAAAG